jgi:Domain of unknown function (DUF4281)
MSSTFAEDLKPLILLGGLDALDLWPAINVVLISYAVLIFAPRWKWTPTLTLITPIFHSVPYVGSLFSPLVDPSIEVEQFDFTTLEGVAGLLKDPNVVFPAWVHYIVFDLLVSRMEVFDSIERGASTTFHFLAVVPCVVCTFMVGPTGFLMYILLRELLLPKLSTDGESKPQSKKML